jgi:hypothetical protein
MKTLILVVTALLLAGCQTTRDVGNENSPYYVVPTGSRLVVNRELTVPAEDVAVYLQGGQVLPQKQLNLYHPQCKLEMRRRLSTTQTIRPGEFFVTKVTQEFTQHMVLLAPIQVADGSLVRRASGGIDGGIGPNTFITNLILASDTQPEVMRMTCGYWGYLNRSDTHLSISQIRGALGEVVTLKIAGQP